MKVVNLFEENLIRILRAVLGHGSFEAVQTLLVRELPRPNCLGRDCIDIVQHDLSRGVVQQLSRWGWANDRFYSNEQPVSGRVWERSDLPLRQLNFSCHTMDWLIWLTSTNFTQPAWLPARPTSTKPLLLGDRLFLLFLFESLQNTLAVQVLIKHPAIRNDGLLWLLFADKFAEIKGEYRGDFSFWKSVQTVWVLEVFQKLLEQRWIEMELYKERIRQPEEMRRLGEIQARVLREFFACINELNRRDLSRFCLLAADKVLHSQSTQPERYYSFNRTDLSLADRVEVYQSALVFMNCLKQLRQWHQAATATTFYDDHYQQSQFWKSEWERFDGHRICDAALAIEKQFDILKKVTN